MALLLRDRGVQPAHHHVVLSGVVRAAVTPMTGRPPDESLESLRYLIVAACFDVDATRRREADAAFFPAIAALG